MDVSSFFVTNAQAGKLIKPSEGSFYYPPRSAQSAAMLGVSPCENRPDPAKS